MAPSYHAHLDSVDQTYLFIDRLFMALTVTQNKQSNWGVIGLGLMGNAIAERILSIADKIPIDGLYGWDLDSDRMKPFSALGGTWLSSSEEIFQKCDVVWLSLPHDRVVTALLSSLPSPMRSSVVIDTTTGDPEAPAHHGELLQKRGGGYFEATISGSSQQVRTGEAVVMLGGDTTLLEPFIPSIAPMFRRVLQTGPLGTASKAKLLTNLVLGLNRAALAEGLHFAEAIGIESTLALELLQGTMAYSRIMDSKGSKMIAREFSPQAKLSQHLKDVLLMLETATRTGCQLPLTETHRALLEKAERLGWGEWDNASILHAWDDCRGAEEPS